VKTGRSYGGAWHAVPMRVVSHAFGQGH